MKKHFYTSGISIAACLCAALGSCANAADNSTQGGGQIPSGTQIQFVNEGAYPAAVYYDAQRSSLAASIGPGGQSDALGAIPLPAAVFYPSFTLIIGDAEILFTPNRAIETRIDENKTTAIPIPYLDQWYGPTVPLVQDAYLAIKNEGGNGFRLQSGAVSLQPLGQSEVEVNAGETAVYRVKEGGAGMYNILSSGQNYPLGNYSITRFEAGHLYTVTFKGAAAAEAAADQTISIANLSPQGDAPAPAGLRAQIAGAQAALSWNAAAEWPRYRVYRSGSAAGVYSPITDYGLTGAAYTDAHASRETLNYYKVRGYSADGRRMSVFSAPAALALAAPPTPAAPVLTADNGQLRAVWTAHPLAERYEVWAGTTDNISGASKKADVRDGVNSAVLGGLANGTRCYVWIKAANNAGTSQPGPSASAVPDAFTQIPPAPAAPVLTARNGEIAVRWQALATASSYTLWYGESGDFAGASRCAAGITGTDAVIGGLENGRTYYVWVQGWNRIGDGPASPAASAQPSNILFAGLYDGHPSLGNRIGDYNKLAPALAYLQTNAVLGHSYYVVLDTDETIAPTPLLASPQRLTNLTLMPTGGPVALSLSGTGSMFDIPSGVTFTLEDGVVLQGLSNNSNALVSCSGGNLVMNGGEICNNSTTSSSFGNYNRGGGVSVLSGGTFTMNDGNIRGNRTIHSGGGVYVYYSSTFTMNGGEISGNTTDYEGGGVRVDFNGTFTMNDGNISGNTTDYEGGGVCVSGSSTFTMNGGEISDNTAEFSGGGVYVSYHATFTMTGGEISGNTVVSVSVPGGPKPGGGGVQVYGTFTMTGGEISGNTALYGGGVFVSFDSSADRKFTKTSRTSNGAVVYGSNAPEALKNSASGAGDAVYLNHGSSKTRNTTIPATEAFDSNSSSGWD